MHVRRKLHTMTWNTKNEDEQKRECEKERKGLGCCCVLREGEELGFI